MAEIEQPPIIEPVTGNIRINGREGLTIEFGLRDSTGADVNISSADLWFEVKGAVRSALAPGANNFRRNIIISQTDTETISAMGARCGVYLPFDVRLEGVVPPQVYWEGGVTVTGFTGAPV